MLNDIDKKARAYALKNALAHDGKAQQGSVISALFHEGLEKSEVGKVAKQISEIVNAVNKMPPEEQQKEFDNLENEVSERDHREGLPELPNVPKTGVVMRFAPAPSGPLHVGHLISNMISSLYVKKYGGKFYVRIEDTNPESIDPTAYENIKTDCDWVFGNVYKYIIQSERMEIYYKYAEKLIKKNAAYVCFCKPDDFKKYVDQKENCPCRSNSLKGNLAEWKKMLSKKGYGEGEAVLRFKTPDEYGGMENPNPAMRDFPLARINLHEHPRQKNKYRVWPLMNLSVTTDDIELGMTHIIRGKDHMDNAKRQEMMYKILGKEKKYPWVFFMGKLKFTDIVLSKRKLKAAIEAGEFSGFDDERLPTLISLRKQGYKPETFAKFAEMRGLNDVDKVMSGKDFFDLLDQLNKEVK